MMTLEDENSRTKKKTNKRVTMEDDEPMIGEKGTIKNNTQRTSLCRSMLIDEFLKVNWQGGEGIELESESESVKEEDIEKDIVEEHENQDEASIDLNSLQKGKYLSFIKIDYYLIIIYFYFYLIIIYFYILILNICDLKE